MKIEYYVVTEFLFSTEPTTDIYGPFNTEIEAWMWVIEQDIHSFLYYVSVMPILRLGG